MLNFNLVPVEQKKEAEKEMFYSAVTGIFKALFLVLATILVLFLSANFVLRFLLSSQKQSFKRVQEDEVVKEVIALDAEIASKNNLIDAVYETKKNIFYLSSTIEKIQTLIPDNVYLKELTIEEKVKGAPSESGEEGSAGEEGGAGGGEGESAEGTAESAQSPEEAPATEGAEEDALETSVQKETYYEVRIVGLAKKRNKVIELEKELQKQKEFTGLVSPLQNILKAEGVDFEFTFKLEK
jgi:hypothetical protein